MGIEQKRRCCSQCGSQGAVEVLMTFGFWKNKNTKLDPYSEVRQPVNVTILTKL